MNRIKYTTNGVTFDAGPFFIDGKPIYVQIGKQSGYYIITNQKDKSITISEQHRTTDTAKRLVRQRLIEMGVVFAKERRISKKKQ